MNLHTRLIGTGPPVVMTSGIGQASPVWEPLANTLADRFSVMTWDYRGHGRSAATDDPADYSAELALNDLLSVMRKAGARDDNRTVLVGHSLGGYLSLRAAITLPELVKALILIATGPGFRDASAREQWNSHAQAMPMDDDVHPEARRMSFHSDGIVMEKLSSIRVPALIIVGSADRRFIGAKNYMQLKMPHATSIEIEGARHSVHVSHPSQVNEAVASFLEGVS